MRATSFAGTPQTVTPSSVSNAASGAPSPWAPSIAQTGVDYLCANRRSLRYPARLTGTRNEERLRLFSSVATAVQLSLCGSMSMIVLSVRVVPLSSKDECRRRTHQLPERVPHASLKPPRWKIVIGPHAVNGPKPAVTMCFLSEAHHDLGNPGCRPELPTTI